MPNEELTVPENFYTVSQIGELTRETLLERFPNPFWVRGEITNLSNQRGLDKSKRYIFIGLKDEKSTISLYISSSSPAFSLLPQLKDGLEIYVYGQFSYYVPQNSVSIRAYHILLSGEGELRRQFELMKQKLQMEGLFDQAHKKPIPKFPRRVGVITSSTGAALRDIISRTKQEYGSVDLIVFPVQVQGKSASSEIAAAIEVANRFFKNDIDVLIVGRGGGSVEDLWAFNEEIVARAIYSSEIPIISAVGHEVDWTIADYVADMRAPTPTAAAEMLLKEIINQNRTLHLIQERLLQLLFHRFQILQQRIENTKSTLSIARLESRLQSTKQKLRSSVARSEIILTNRLESLRFSLDKAHNNLLSLHRRRLSNTAAKLTLLHEKLAHLNPHNILNKGYSLTYYETPQGEKLLRSSNEVRPHTKLRTVLSSGEVQSSVITTQLKTEKIHPNETV